jgi:Na+-translocating ferredoxin:NAD+ oxidoreductase RnfE subunit
MKFKIGNFVRITENTPIFIRAESYVSGLIMSSIADGPSLGIGEIVAIDIIDSSYEIKFDYGSAYVFKDIPMILDPVRNSKLCKALS